MILRISRLTIGSRLLSALPVMRSQVFDVPSNEEAALVNWEVPVDWMTVSWGFHKVDDSSGACSTRTAKQPAAVASVPE